MAAAATDTTISAIPMIFPAILSPLLAGIAAATTGMLPTAAVPATIPASAALPAPATAAPRVATVHPACITAAVMLAQRWCNAPNPIVLTYPAHLKTSPNHSGLLPDGSVFIIGLLLPKA